MSALLKKIFASSIGKTKIPISVVFCDGSTYVNTEAQPELKITYKSWRAQLNSMINHGWGLIESYISQEVDIAGDLRLLIAEDAETGH